MDQLSAHLDHGWDLIQRGDSQGAEVSARRALELDSHSPEAYNLLGYVAALQGEYEEAIEHYRQAITLDDSYLEAVLNAAEVHIHPLGEYQEALRLCELALELVETEEELVDTLLLKFDALLAKGDIDEARNVCASFPKGPFDNKYHSFLVGRALYEVGDMEGAAPLIEEAARSNVTNAEALYYLGLLREESGDGPAAIDAFLRSREIDMDQPRPPWSLTRQTFEQSVKRVIATLQPELRVFLREDEVYLADAPGAEVVVDGVDPRALVLLDSGVLDASSQMEAPRARVFVYQRNVERIAGQLDLIEDELRAALERELRTHFVEGGIDDPPPKVSLDKLN